MKKDGAFQVRYRKSMDRYYLVVEPEKEAEENYQLRMLLENRIPGLLPLEVKLREGKKELHYDVSSMQPLSRVYDRRELNGEEIRRIFFGILDAISGMRDYLLDEEGVVLDPAYIFTDMESGTIRLLFLPFGYDKAEEDPMLQPAEFLMEHADHRDPQAALCAYRIYQTIRKGNYVAADLRRALEEETQKETPATGRLPQIPPEAVYTPPAEIPKDRTDAGHFERDLPAPATKTPAEAGKTTGAEQASKKLPLLLAAAMILCGGVVIGGVLPGVHPDAAGKLVIVAAMAAGVAVLLSSRFRGKRTEAPEADWDRIAEAFADMEPQPDEMTEFAAMDRTGAVAPGEEEYGKTVFAGAMDVKAENILYDMGKKKEYRMEHFPFTIGKMRDCVDLALSDRSVSRIHARILLKDGRAYLQDCHSTNGTYLNGVQLEVEETVMLEREDEIEIGKVKFRYL